MSKINKVKSLQNIEDVVATSNNKLGYSCDMRSDASANNDIFKRYFGCMKGMIKINCDLVNTSFDDNWEACKAHY